MEEQPKTIQLNQPQELSYNLHQAGSMMQLATTLADFVKEKKLCQDIKGRQYVNVEGWQFCGGMLGMLPIVKGTKNLSTDSEIKYEADVELVNINTGAIVGAGNAVCSNKEQGKKYFEEYAINSMSQTRAIGKAYRNTIGWLMKAAGYEATPLEEMDQVAQQELEVKEAVFEYLKAESREEALAIWNKYKQHRNNFYFQKAAKALGALYPKVEELEPISGTEAEEVTERIADEVKDDYRADGKATVNGKTYEEATPEERAKVIEAREKKAEPKTMNPSQRKEILELLKNPAQTQDTVTKVTTNLDKLDYEKAAQTIRALKKNIAESAQKAGEAKA